MKQSNPQGTFEFSIVNVSPETNGKILNLPVKEGDYVNEGDLLFQMDTIGFHISLKTLEASRERAEFSRIDISVQTASLQEQLQHLKSERDRVDRLLAGGVATRKQKEDLDNQINVVEKQLKAAKNSMNLTNNASASGIESISSEIEGQKILIEKCKVTAPLSGIILNCYFKQGEVAEQGHPVVRIADTSTAYLRAYFTSAQLHDIYLGQQVKVRAIYGTDKFDSYDGIISWISEESEFTPKTIPTTDERSNLVYAVKIAVTNDKKIKSGFLGEVILD